MTEKLKLIARDAEDLDVISSVLQDAIVPMNEISFIPAERCFALVANRFLWEASENESEGDRPEIHERVVCAVRFDGVSAVKRQQLDPARLSMVLSLLAIRRGAEYIDLFFSGGGTIRLVSAGIDCRLDDLDVSWPTRLKPAHPED